MVECRQAAQTLSDADPARRLTHPVPGNKGKNPIRLRAVVSFSRAVARAILQAISPG